MTNLTPIPQFGIPAVVRPNIGMPITLYLHLQDGINWNGRGEPATKAQLEKAIDQCRGQHIPNDLLPALDPGDVVVLADGVFWIDRDWNVQACDLAET
jgi:hypothetical protein